MSDVLNKSSLKHLIVGGAAVAAIIASGACLYLLLKEDEEFSHDGRKISSRQVAIEVKIPKDMAGVVIGRQGSNIKEIQAKTETRINFKDELETEDYKVACIRGLPDDAQHAEILIYQTIAQQPKVESVTLHIPEIYIGKIIGRGGENVKEIQRVSRCKVDIDRGPLGGYGNERKVVLKGSSSQINAAKELIEEYIKEEKSMRLSIESRQSRNKSKSKEPLFLSYEETEQENKTSLQGVNEELKPSNSDYCMDVMVSSICSPSSFSIQKVGPESAELDRLTQTMTDYYKEDSNKVYHKLAYVNKGDIVACRFSSEESFYRARVVDFKEDTYDIEKSTVDLDFVDFGDCEEKVISEVYELKTEFLKLKFQAIQCSLAHIKPYPGPEWSTQALDQFESLSHCAMWKVVCAKVVDYLPNDVPRVELLDTNNKEGDINVGQELIKQGLAVWTKENEEKINIDERVN